MIKKGQVYQSQLAGSKLIYEVLSIKGDVLNVKMISGKGEPVILTLQPTHFLKMVGINEIS